MNRKIYVILVFTLLLLSTSSVIIIEAEKTSIILMHRNNANIIIENLGPILLYYPESHDFGDKLEGEVDSSTFKIWNAGCCYLMYSLIENCGWVNVSPTSGGCGTGYDNNDTITISINTTGLTLGTYNCEILIMSTVGNENFAVTVNIIETPNSLPSPPSINGPISGKTGEEYEYTFATTDPDGDDVYYYIEWGDGQIEEWIGPYTSEEIIPLTHIWNEQGMYTIKVKAKDSHDDESEWSEPLQVWISANIEIEINGGFGISVVVKNLGEEDISNLFWSIEFIGILLGGKTMEGLISSIPVGSDNRINIYVFGIGPGSVNVTIENISKTAKFYIIGPFVMMN